MAKKTEKGISEKKITAKKPNWTLIIAVIVILALACVLVYQYVQKADNSDLMPAPQPVYPCSLEGELCSKLCPEKIGNVCLYSPIAICESETGEATCWKKI